ncbi:MAG: class I SAM-dependent methyltransferase [Bacteroidetes Order II. Incertae sedis bacterium]|nr:class I SAM-dependent methyltransferase [Bacteroidetes Order II. bacterium]
MFSTLKTLFFLPIPGGLKGRAELLYWLLQFRKQGGLDNTHYEPFFTTFFGFSRSDFAGKKLLDIGCGPRGSLEWATSATERVGLDPLAEVYRLLGIDQHKMVYKAAGSEQIPFSDNYFDVVSSFNSLDHVADLNATIAEIKRVLAPSGYFMLITDIGHKPTITEPRSFGFEIVEAFSPELSPIRIHKFEKSVKGAIYESLRKAIPYDEDNPTPRYGILTALFRK